MIQDYQLDHSLSLRLYKSVFDNVLLEHVALLHVLPLAVRARLGSDLDSGLNFRDSTLFLGHKSSDVSYPQSL